MRTIVEPTAMFGGRDVRFMRRVSEETGVRLVPCTGIYTYDYLPHYFKSRDADQIADHFVQDIEEGIQGTDIRAAFIKCAADAAGVTENVEKVHRAAARASNKTGVPVMAHSMPAVQTGPRQVEIFLEEGVPAERIQIAHCGDSDSVEYIEGLLAKGVYAGLDRYGIEMYLPITKRNEVAAELLRRGHAEHIVISQDFTASLDWFPPEMVTVLRRERRRAQLVDVAGLRGGRPVPARAGRDGRRGVRHHLRREPAPLADRPSRAGRASRGLRRPVRHG